VWCGVPWCGVPWCGVVLCGVINGLKAPLSSNLFCKQLFDKQVCLV